jgi:hypothetical protein
MLYKFKIYLVILTVNLICNQIFSQEPVMERFNATNYTWLQKLSFYDINIEGSPYLDENFVDGEVVLDSLIIMTMLRLAT